MGTTRFPTLLAGLALLALMVPAAGQEARTPDRPPNLLRNAGFETRASGGKAPAAWQVDARTYALDRTVSHSGRVSLRWTGEKTRADGRAAQPFAIEASAHPRRYEFGGWIRTERLAGARSKHAGAIVRLLAFGPDGRFLGGTVAEPRVTGTRDWTRVRGVMPVPGGGATLKLRVECLTYPAGLSGTAWFDDIEVRAVPGPVLDTLLLSPLYRGRITARGPATVRVRARIDPEPLGRRLEDLRLRCELLTLPARRRVQQTTAAVRDPTTVVDLPLAALEAGDHALRVELLETRTGAVVAAREHRLQRVPDDFEPAVAIDRHRRLLVDGKPFFPLGMYAHIREDKDAGGDMRLLGASRFNCVMQYGSPSRQQLDLAHRHGVKVIYDIGREFFHGDRATRASIRSAADEEAAVREQVRRFRSHPALLAWYLYDEPPLALVDRLEAHGRWIAEEDPDHPTWLCVAKPHWVGQFLHAADAIGSDPYPIPFQPASLAADYTRETLRQVEGARAVWMIPQAFNWVHAASPAEPHRRNGRMPSFEEMRSMAWQCICHGATGLVFYEWWGLTRDPVVSFDTSWTALKRIAAEIDALAPAILSIESPPEVSVRAGEWLHWMVRLHGGKLYLVAASDGRGHGKATFRLPRPPGRIEVRGEDRSIAARAESFADTFAPRAVHVYEMDWPPK